MWKYVTAERYGSYKTTFVYCENYKEHINETGGENAEILMLNLSVQEDSYWAVKSYVFMYTYLIPTEFLSMSVMLT
jgi:hypothetical protein